MCQPYVESATALTDMNISHAAKQLLNTLYFSHGSYFV